MLTANAWGVLTRVGVANALQKNVTRYKKRSYVNVSPGWCNVQVTWVRLKQQLHTLLWCSNVTEYLYLTDRWRGVIPVSCMSFLNGLMSATVFISSSVDSHVLRPVKGSAIYTVRRVLPHKVHTHDKKQGLCTYIHSMAVWIYTVWFVAYLCVYLSAL